MDENKAETGSLVAVGGTLRLGGLGGGNDNQVGLGHTITNVANDVTLAGGSIFAVDGIQHFQGAFTVSADSNITAQYSDKGIYLDGPSQEAAPAL